MRHPVCRTVLLITFLFILLPVHGEQKLNLTGRVKEAIGKTDLTNAIAILYDGQGNPVDSVRADKGATHRNGERVTLSYFSFNVPHVDSVYTYDVMCDGYITQTFVYRVKDLGKRERYRNLPVAYLERAPRKLDEVTVIASKIKFYHKGDTLVYNADAFQLAEGSMLDALIAQLPGVELKDNGQIMVNGEYVESLLLNGKEFLDGNNQLMLENIGAYTVKNVEVYKGQTKREKWIDDPTAPKHLTMDVKLKKEYNIGLILNAQAGYGTEDRYIGRLFASWFNPTSEVVLIANSNNLNDSRKPGKDDSWTPEMMPSGTRRYNTAALQYNFRNAEETRNLRGYVEMEQSSLKNRTTTARTNFLSNGDTYENAFSAANDKKLRLETRNYLYGNTERLYLWGMMVGRYIKRDNSSSSLSASFDTEQKDVTLEALEALYSDSSPERLEAVINRSVTRTDGSSSEKEIQLYPEIDFKIPGTHDRLRFQIGLRYKNNKEERWRDYNINYGADPAPAVRKRQFFDNSPNHTFIFDGTLGYHCNITNGLMASMTYSYRFYNQDRDSYMFALDRLEAMGIFGTLPAGYLDTFDPSNSYTSRLNENKHEIIPSINWYKFSDKYRVILRVSPTLALMHSHLNYWRDNRSYPVSRSSFLAVAKRYDASVQVKLGPVAKAKSTVWRHSLEYQYLLDTKTPDLLHMVDIENDSDPLNISVGNPGLKNSMIHKHELSWRYTGTERPISERLVLRGEMTTDALVRGYTYDTTTGIRRNRTYNVDGNNSIGLSNHFNLQFGKRQQFTLSLSTDASIRRYADMIGVNLDAPVRSRVRTDLFTQGIRLVWQIGKQNIGITGSMTSRHTTSTREDFNTITAKHYNYGMRSEFSLPAGFGISTDFMFYTRTGYGLSYLDTTDAIWNLRLSYTPAALKGRLVFMADGFDLLHQLSNVNYAVTASGRTVSYSNALPRYLLFSVQYRFNMQPKKR